MDKVLETPWLTTEQQKIWRSFLGGSTVLLDRLLGAEISFTPILDPYSPEIAATLAYIKSTWPERERTFQDEVTRNDALTDDS